MYRQFYGLRDIPFSLAPDPKYLFRTDSLLEVFANLQYGIESGNGLVVVTGEVLHQLGSRAHNPEEDVYLRPGDTVIVHGNLFKTMLKLSNVVGVTTLATFLTRGGR